MTHHTFTLCDETLTARASRTLWWSARRLLAVSDLHLGKSGRIARRGGTLLPPYETRDTLARLEAEIAATDPATVLCLGDSFDDTEAAALPAEEAAWLARLMEGRRWIWIAGNHDPLTAGAAAGSLAELREGPFLFRHVAEPGARAEISGHYHPKARLGPARAPCFLIDAGRGSAILPAFGTFTGGLDCGDRAFGALMGEGAVAVVTGSRALAIPMPRSARGLR